MNSFLFTYRSNILYNNYLYTFLRFHIIFREYEPPLNPHELSGRKHYKCDYSFTKKFKGAKRL